jgi:hypothetical protein
MVRDGDEGDGCGREGGRWARSVAPVSKPGAERRAPVNIFLTVTQ